MERPKDHPTILTGKVGVLVVNLGTPDAPDAGSVKRYLKEFLSDRRVVEIPALVWQPILRGIILNTRPKKSAHAYAQVWTDEGSPLAAITKAQARALQARLGDAAIVRHAMRYQSPAMAKELDALLEAGCERILVAPLYPHYSGATTASALDAVRGLGETRRRALVTHFGSLARLRQASVEEITAVPGIGVATAAAVLDALGAGETDQSAASPAPVDDDALRAP